MDEPIRIHIDLATGAVDVTAPVDAIDSVFAKLEAFLPQLAGAYNRRDPGKGAGGDSQGDNTDAETDVSSSESTGAGGKMTGRRKGGSKSKETYKIVSIDMDESKRTEFRAFFEQKAPSGQNDQTLVVMYGLKAMGKLSACSKDQIFSGFRMLPSIKVPGKISSVLGNLVGGGYVKNIGVGMYEITHVGEDRVKLELPAKKPSKK
jgi:hypothetical protein